MSSSLSLRSVSTSLGVLFTVTLGACLFPSFDDLICETDCIDGGGGGSGGAGGSSNAPCGTEGVLIDGPGDIPYCIGKTELPLSRYCDFLEAVVDEVELNRPTVCDWQHVDDLTECLVTGADACGAIFETCNDAARPNGQLPATGMDWCGAATFCAWDGKRLCGKVGGVGLDDDPLRSEWVVACKPSTATPGACLTSGCSSHLDLVSEGSSCEGGVSGLFNMIGNVSEWVDNCEGTDGPNDYCEPRGGDCFEGPIDAVCSTLSPPRRRDDGGVLGFRCCWDP